MQNSIRNIGLLLTVIAITWMIFEMTTMTKIERDSLNKRMDSLWKEGKYRP